LFAFIKPAVTATKDVTAGFDLFFAW